MVVPPQPVKCVDLPKWYPSLSHCWEDLPEEAGTNAGDFLVVLYKRKQALKETSKNGKRKYRKRTET